MKGPNVSNPSPLCITYTPFYKAINSISQLQTLQKHSSHLAKAAMSDHKEVSLGKYASAVTFYIYT